VVIGATALAFAFIGLIALMTGTLDDFLPGGRRNPYSANNVEKVHTMLRATVIIVAVCAILGSALFGLWYMK